MHTRLLPQSAIGLHWTPCKLHKSRWDGKLHWMCDFLCFDWIWRMCSLNHELYQIFCPRNVRTMWRWILCHQYRRMRNVTSKLFVCWHERRMPLMWTRIRYFTRNLLTNASKLHDYWLKWNLLKMHGRLLYHFRKNVWEASCKLYYRQYKRSMHTMWWRICCHQWRMHYPTSWKSKLRRTELKRRMYLMQEFLWTHKWRLYSNWSKSFL